MDLLAPCGQRLRAGTIGLVGAGIPAEVMLACGAHPVRILPRGDSATPLADALVGVGETAEMRALLERALDGELALLDLLVIGRAYEWLYYYLKEAVRLGNERVPPLHLFDVVPSAYPSLANYGREQIERLIGAGARATGRSPTTESWTRAFATVSRRRAVLRELQARRDSGEISGADAVAIVAFSQISTIDEFVGNASTRFAKRAAPSGPRVLLLSNNVDPDGSMHRAIEAAGVTIVAEDSEWGSRSAVPDPTPSDDPVSALLRHLIETASGPDVSPREVRLRWAETAIERDDIDAVVFAIPPYDRKFGWDYPALRDRVTALGRPQLLVRECPRRDPSMVTLSVADFVQQLINEVAA